MSPFPPDSDPRPWDENEPQDPDGPYADLPMPDVDDEDEAWDDDGSPNVGGGLSVMQSLDRLTSDVEQIVEEVATVNARLDVLEAQAEQDRTPPTSWAQRATREDWEDLVDWVDWLQDTYEHRDLSNTLRGCWPAHGGVVEELAALQSAWKAAQRKARRGDTDAVMYWHDRGLHPFVARLSAYQVKACDHDRHKESLPAPKTRRHMVVIESTGEVGLDTPTD